MLAHWATANLIWRYSSLNKMKLGWGNSSRGESYGFPKVRRMFNFICQCNGEKCLKVDTATVALLYTSMMWKLSRFPRVFICTRDRDPQEFNQSTCSRCMTHPSFATELVLCLSCVSLFYETTSLIYFVSMSRLNHLVLKPIWGYNKSFTLCLKAGGILRAN